MSLNAPVQVARLSEALHKADRMLDDASRENAQLRDAALLRDVGGGGGGEDGGEGAASRLGRAARDAAAREMAAAREAVAAAALASPRRGSPAAEWRLPLETTSPTSRPHGAVEAEAETEGGISGAGASGEGL